MKSIKMSNQARESIKAGIDKLADLVKVTIGPKGRNVIISKNYGNPIITNDGVTIAKQVQLQDQFEDLGARMCRMVAQKTNDQAGDGTTTATILAQAIVNQGNSSILKGVNAIFLQRALQKYGEKVVQYIKSLSYDISNQQEIQNIASISANNDQEIGKIISMAIQQSGIDGVINIEQSKTMETWLERVQGMQVNSGFISPYFATDPVKMQVEMQDVYILVFNGKIFSIPDIINLLKFVADKKSSLLVIAQDVQGQALATMVVNKAKGIVNACAIKLPGMGENKKQIAQDICAVVGAEYLAKQTGTNLQKIEMSQLGFASKVIVGQNSTVIRQGLGTREKIEERINSIKFKMDKSSNIMQADRYQKRIAKIIQGVSVIHIGAQTQIQLKEKKFRMQDALNATKAAIEEGIVAGAGTTLVKASYFLNNLNKGCLTSETRQELIAKEILQKALLYPLQQIIYNSGIQEQQMNKLIQQIRVSDKSNYGYNVLTNKLEDLHQTGIIDPVKVVRCALQNAISIAGLFLTTEGIILQHRTEQSQNQDMFGGM